MDAVGRDLRSLVARHHESYNARDLDALSDVFDEDVEIVVDGAALHGVAEALGYATAIVREFPRLRIHGTRVIADLVGLADRVAALDGRLRIESPADGGTVVAAAIPLPV